MASSNANPDAVVFQFTPSAEVAAEAALLFGCVPSTTLTYTAKQILKTQQPTLFGENSAAGVAAKRQEILDYFHTTYTMDEQLYDVINDPASFYLRPDSLRHPMYLRTVFYYGHTAAVYRKVTQTRINEKFESMLAVGVDEMSWDDLAETSYDWPSIADLTAYRMQVRILVDRFIRCTKLNVPIGWDSPWYVVFMGIEHQRIHIETSSVLLRQMPIATLHPIALLPHCPVGGAFDDEKLANELLPVPASTIDLAKSSEHRLYGWDNEFGTHVREVSAFKASKYIVSNREYLEFVNDGGYEKQQYVRAEYWTAEGWKWKTWRKFSHPIFWQRKPDHAALPPAQQYLYRTMTELIEMPWAWPVDLNQLESKAYCNWLSEKRGKSIRLPTEEEWAALRIHTLPLEVEQDNWKAAPGNINLEYYGSSTPVNMFPFAHGFFDIIGNVWQHTESPIDEFTGFRVHQAYEDFSVPTFDTRHNIMKGGSWISTGNEATFHGRYAFRRHFFQHAGCRYVEADAPVVYQHDKFERMPRHAIYLEQHYGDVHLSVPNFQCEFARFAINAAKTVGVSMNRVLDVGCGPGRTTFELARGFQSVTGIDFTTRFFYHGANMQKSGEVNYALPDDGVKAREVTRYSAAMNITAEMIEKVQFYQCDACNMETRFQGFDVIVAPNTIETLYSPRLFLEQVHQRLVKGGVLILASTFKWDTAYTPRHEWLCCPKGSVDSLPVVESILLKHFRRVPNIAAVEMPSVVRESARRFQYNLSLVTVYQKID